ncbi:hypothetical protein Q3G72_004655 [Acer saccharum]|nr:hypothetical protein Q3G72_004655 [Acer saccharum]
MTSYNKSNPTGHNRYITCLLTRSSKENPQVALKMINKEENTNKNRKQIRRLVRLEIWVSGDSEGWVFQRK